MENFIVKMPLALHMQAVTPAEKAVLFAIYSFTNNGKGACFAGQRKIAKRAGCDRKTVRREVEKLISKKLIKVSGRKKVFGGYTYVYAVIGGAGRPTNEKKESKVGHHAPLNTKGGADSPTKGKKVGRSVPHNNIASLAKGPKLSIKEKPGNISADLWERSLSLLEERWEENQAKGTPIKNPQRYFESLLKSMAEEMGEHEYLAHLCADHELKEMLEKGSITHQAYYLEAEKRRLI